MKNDEMMLFMMKKTFAKEVQKGGEKQKCLTNNNLWQIIGITK